jgi:hypothetical protein
MGEQSKACAVRAVHVLGHQQDRTPRRGPLDKPQHGIEQA